jgi:hypothetical protein
MSSSAYYLGRAEKLRLALLCTLDPIAAIRLRNFIEKYRNLAERANKKIDCPPLDPVEHEHGFAERAEVSVD